MEVVTPGPADLARLRSGLEGLGLGEITLQEFGGPSDVLVRAERQPDGEEAQTQAPYRRSARSSPRSIPDRRSSALRRLDQRWAVSWRGRAWCPVVLASFAMLVYIWVRFEWPFAVGAIATLILDVTKTVGFFALTGLDFNLTAIAALLTLIGYSVNDKVVVYDRMRENMRLYKQMSLRDLIDRSINETLARSLYTSVTAFLALLPMAIWGGSPVESFAIPMVFGIVVAASSSIFIAAPILLFLGDWRSRRRGSVPEEAPAAA
jgi:SecD/SecF fusion protein